MEELGGEKWIGLPIGIEGLVRRRVGQRISCALRYS